MDYLQGQLLIRSPHLLEPNFARTVILLIQHDQDGALGVIVNRPTNKTVKQLWEDLDEGYADCELPVYSGGPVPGPLITLHDDESLAGSEPVPNVFLTTAKVDLDRLVQQHGPYLRFFVGNVGWAPWQLEGELEAGHWLTTPATAEHVFHNVDNLWGQVLKHIGEGMYHSVLKIKHVPKDASMN